MKMKKNKSAFLMIIASGLLFSCEPHVVTPQFAVSAVVEKTIVQSEDGESELDAYNVTFKFTGSADNIVFYSGEQGSDYRYKNRDSRTVTPHIQFATSFNGGSIENTLKVLVSNDFKPEYEYLSGAPSVVVYSKYGVNNATWTDITDRFILPGNKLVTGLQDSGEAIISEFHDDLPLFIAFQFKAEDLGESSIPGSWSFSQFNITNVYEDGSSALFVEDGVTNDWKSVDLGAPVQCSKGTGQITLSSSSDEDINTMLISVPYYPSHVETDKGFAIKSTDEALDDYTYTYIAPETKTMHVAFVVTNSLYGKSIQVVKELDVVLE